VRTEQVQTTSGCTSGLALIGVEDSGQNAITVIGGANSRLTPADVGQRDSVIVAADALLVQFEVPLETVVAAVKLARQHTVPAILDPAPAPKTTLPRELYSVGLLSPNQIEAEALTGTAVQSPADAIRAAAILHERGVRRVVIKLGEQGALASEAGCDAIHIPAAKVAVVDTTAAGDAFTAALTVALCEGHSLSDATRFACAAGSLATTRPGAQDAMPARADVERLFSLVPSP
jgi:ribokinase